MDNQDATTGGIVPNTTPEKPVISLSPVIPEIPRPEATPAPQKAQEVSIPVKTTTPHATPQPISSFREKEPEIKTTQRLPASGGASMPLGKKVDIKKILTLAGIAGGALLVILGTAYIYLTFLKTATVLVNSNQDSLSLSIDSESPRNVQTPYTLRLKPGTYTIVASKEDFVPITKTVVVDGFEGSQELVFDLLERPAIAQLSDAPIYFPVYDDATNAILYFAKTDDTYAISQYQLTTGETTVLVTQPIRNIENAIWSPSHTQVIVSAKNVQRNPDELIQYLEQYGEGEYINWSINLVRQDLVNVSAKALHPTIRNVSFSPGGDKIAYFFKNDIERTLAVAKNDGSDFERILQFQELPFDPDVVWSPDGRYIALYAKDQNAPESDIYLYSFETRSALRVTRDGASRGALFSSDGSRLLFLSGDSLALYEMSASEEAAVINLGITAPLAATTWLDATTAVAVGSSIWLINQDGTAEQTNYKQSTLPSDVMGVVTIDTNRVALTSSNGLYSLDLTKTISQ